MLVSMVAWAKKREGLRFTLFSPMNETDIGSPEGPTVAPADFVRVLEILDKKLTQAGLDDIRLVVADQAHFSADYVREIARNPRLVKRVAVFGMHTYGLVPHDRNEELTTVVEGSPYRDCRLWMTEYGDLEQSGEREWYVAWQITKRLFRQLEEGFHGAIIWDAYDNYHDHNEAWTIYGLLRTGLRVHTPKKRYYASKQVYRYVLPGFERVEAHSQAAELRVLAFANRDRTQFTLVGMNDSAAAFRPNVRLEGFDDRLMAGRAYYLRTTGTENCHRIGTLPVRNRNHPFTGIDPFIPAYSVFTLTTVRD
jgi:O-glycosyl hydrolase